MLKQLISQLQKEVNLSGETTFMNKNEECLIKFLVHPGRLDKTTSELKEFIFSKKDNIINKEFAFTKTKPAING